MPEEDIILNFLVNGDVNSLYVVDHLWLGDQSGNIEFPWHVPILDYPEKYIIEIKALPVEGEGSIADNSRVWNFSIEPEPGAISGWVFDQWNNPVEGAIVKVIDSTVGDYGSTTSDSDGYYYLDGLKPTPEPEDYYTLEAYKEGIGKQTKTGIAVHSFQTTEGKNFNIMGVEWTQITSGEHSDNDAFWSPSGDRLAFTRTVNPCTPSWYYAITVINEDGSGLKYMTGPGKPASQGRRPAWSPDGTKILFDDGANIWLMSASGTGSDAYMKIPIGSHGTWSPDSRSIAFCNYNSPAHGQIYIYNLDTSTITPVTPSGEYRELAWSPDGKWIASAEGSIRIVDVDTGETEFIGMQGNHPSWLPDSTGFLFSSNQYDIWLYRVDTKEFIQITFGPEYDEDPSIPLQNPSKIAFTSDKGIVDMCKHAVFAMDFSVPGLYFTEIAPTPSIFTPNGDGVNDEFNLSYKINKDAYVTVKIYDSLGGYVRTLLSNALQMEGSYSDYWDGKNQEGNRDNDEVYFYTLDMHDANEVAIPAYGRVGMHKNIRDIPGGAACPRWSHDGSKILYTKEEYDPDLHDNVNHIYVCDANDFSNKQLIETPFRVQRKADWSRDDSKIVFSSNNTENQLQIAKMSPL
jgi:gliding motility-associated-like protein